MKTLLLMVTLAFWLPGCASPSILLVHPRSGDMVECSSSGTAFGAVSAQSYVKSCAEQYEAAGFIPAERLTPEQKAEINPGRFIDKRKDFKSEMRIGSSPPPLPFQQQPSLNLLCQEAIANRDRGGMFVHCR